MIPFLREIRKTIINSGAGKKYFLYAIGEIALVVIGILIALQINNWNEERKNQTFEQQILAELLQDLRNDTAAINSQIRRYNKIISLVDYSLSNSSPTDSLNSKFSDFFGGILFNLNTTTFETLQGKGLHSLRNSELRRTISEYYNKCQWYLDMVNMKSRDFDVIYQEPFKKEHILIVYDDKDTPGSFSMDWEYLSGAEELKKFLGFKKYNLQYRYYFYDLIFREAEECMASIQRYLDTE